MPNVSANEIVTQRHKRNFIQFGGASPANAVKYAGQDAQYMKIEGVSAPEEGGVDPIFVPDPQQSGRFRLVGRKITPPDLANATVVMLEKKGAIPRQLQRIGCAFNLYELTGDCKDLSDFVGGWTDYVLIYSGGLVTDKDLGDRSAWDSDDQIEDSLTITLSDVYPVGALSFGENAATIITLETIDLVYGSKEQCGSCGPADDGTNRIYAITKSSGATPGTAPRLIYTVDGGANWVQSSVTGLGDIEDPSAIEIVGKYLIVMTRTAGGPTTGGYYYSEINTDTGVPGTWTKVTTGFVATFQPYDLYVLSPREIFFCADGGYIYKSTDITSGVTVISAGSSTPTALFRIHGVNETIVCVGGSGVIVKSTNRGVTWATTTTYPVVATLSAVTVINGSLFWVGSASGKIYFTLNGGETWTEKTFSGSGAGQVRDIVFVNGEVGYFSHDTATPTGRIFATWNGGSDWTNSSPRILNVLTANRFNRIAVPNVHPSIAANNVAVAGLAGNGSDGILMLGIASRL